VDAGGDWGALVVVGVYSMVALVEWCGHNRTSVPAGHPNETTLCCAFRFAFSLVMRRLSSTATQRGSGGRGVSCRALAVLHPVGQVIRPRLSLGPPCCSKALTVSFAPAASCEAHLNMLVSLHGRVDVCSQFCVEWVQRVRASLGGDDDVNPFEGCTVRDGIGLTLRS
jgi:hypothetical protein